MPDFRKKMPKLRAVGTEAIFIARIAKLDPITVLITVGSALRDNGRSADGGIAAPGGLVAASGKL